MFTNSATAETHCHDSATAVACITAASERLRIVRASVNDCSQWTLRSTGRTTCSP
jgi:hypothetical protein